MLSETFPCCNNIHNWPFSLETCEFYMVSYANKVILLSILIQIQLFDTMFSFTEYLKKKNHPIMRITLSHKKSSNLI